MQGPPVSEQSSWPSDPNIRCRKSLSTSRPLRHKSGLALLMCSSSPVRTSKNGRRTGSRTKRAGDGKGATCSLASTRHAARQTATSPGKSSAAHTNKNGRRTRNKRKTDKEHTRTSGRRQGINMHKQTLRRATHRNIRTPERTSKHTQTRTMLTPCVHHDGHMQRVLGW